MSLPTRRSESGRIDKPVETAWINRGIDSSVRATVLSINGLADAVGQIVAGPLIGLIASLRWSADPA